MAANIVELRARDKRIVNLNHNLRNVFSSAIYTQAYLTHTHTYTSSTHTRTYTSSTHAHTHMCINLLKHFCSYLTQNLISFSPCREREKEWKRDGERDRKRKKEWKRDRERKTEIEK